MNTLRLGTTWAAKYEARKQGAHRATMGLAPLTLSDVSESLSDYLTNPLDRRALRSADADTRNVLAVEAWTAHLIGFAQGVASNVSDWSDRLA